MADTFFGGNGMVRMGHTALITVILFFDGEKEIFRKFCL